MVNLTPIFLIIILICIYIIFRLWKYGIEITNKLFNEKKLNRKGKNPISKIKQTIYIDILNRTNKALNRLNIPMFLSSGTCLGYFREGKFIDYDYDIDVGIFAEDYNPQIIDEMKKEGLYLYRILGNKKTGMELSFRKLGTPLGKYAKIDIFLHYHENYKNNKYICWYTYAAPHFKKKIKYRVNSFEIKKVNFLGINVYVPHPTIKYIENHYGKDWMIPKKPFTEYIYYKSPVSLVSS